MRSSVASAEPDRADRSPDPGAAHGPTPRRRVAAACDGAARAVLVALVVATPFAFGSVHRPAYAALEAAVFALAAIAGLKLALAGPPARHSVVPRWIWIPAASLAALGWLQLAPLPPSVLARLSPTAWDVLAESLPGWPEHAPYADVLAAPADGPSGAPSSHGWEILPTRAEVASRRDATPPGVASEEVAAPLAIARPLSLAPARTLAAALKAASYVTLLLVLLLYPWNGGAAGEARATRLLLHALALTAVAVAAVALLQRLTWNGRILWFFIPLDWPSGLPDPRPRVSGPFVSRNSLAGYLAMALPLVVVWAAVRSHVDLAPPPPGRRLLRCAGALVVALALLGSLSRGGWIAAAAGLACLVGLLRRLPARQRPAWLGTRRLVAGAACAAVVAAGLALVPGEDGAPNDLDLRLEQTFTDSSSLTDRIGFWRAAARAARDFALLGAGLGAWPEVAPHYDETPAGRGFPREVHSDYLQLLAESGLVGAALLAVLDFAVVRRIAASLAVRSPAGLPLAAASLAGFAAVALHVAVDFDLQIPAIPVALVVLAATALRPVLPRAPSRDRPGVRAAGAAVAVTALSLAGLSLLQPPLPGPREAASAASVADAVALVAERPANALPHLRLYQQLGTTASAPLRRRELAIALRLAPRDPAVRDAFAAELAAAGERSAALAQLEESVRVAPRAEDHAFLQPHLLGWLDDGEAAAVERGLRGALGEHPAAAPTLARLLTARGRPADAGAVLAAAAERAPLDRERVALLVAAADAFLAAGEGTRAEAALHGAIALAPASTAAWSRLVRTPRTGAAEDDEAVAARGIAAGADAAELWFAVAEAAKVRGARTDRRDALQRALRARPGLAKLHFELGLVELEDGRPPRAARAFARAAELDPSRLAAWYHLGRAEERAFRLLEARRAYERALAIDPSHAKARAALAALGSVPGRSEGAAATTARGSG